MFFLLVLCRTAGAQDARKRILSAADAGTCTADSTACFFLTIPSGAGGATFTITANASGNTIQFEATGDTEPAGSHTWVALSVFPSNSTTSATSTTGTGTWQANVAGFTQVRLRMSTLAGGTTTTYINLSTASASAGRGSVTHAAGPLTAFHIVLGNGAGDETVDSACVTNGTGALSGCTSISTGSGASAAGATATGGFACVEGASTGWTPTAGQDYIRCDSTLHTPVGSGNGVAEAPVDFGTCATTNAIGLFTAASTLGCGNADFTIAGDTFTMAAPGALSLFAGGSNSVILPNVSCSASATSSHTYLAANDSDNGELCINRGSGGYNMAVAAAVGSTATTCTNQVVTAVSSLVAPTCTTLTSAYLPSAIPVANGGTGLATQTVNVIYKGNTASAEAVSSMTDNGTTVTTTDTGGFVGPVFTTNGTTAGFVDYPQGTTSAAVTPCNTGTSICEQAPTAVTSYLVNKPGVSATGITTNNVAAAVITQGISGDANHSATVTTGSGTSIGSTTLCSSANCPAGTYVVHVYIDITTACGTTGTYLVNLIYTDDQGAKTSLVNINGTGAVPATGVLTTTSTANYGENSQVLRLTSGNLNYSTTATACGSAGPMVGKLYMAAVPVM